MAAPPIVVGAIAVMVLLSSLPRCESDLGEMARTTRELVGDMAAAAASTVSATAMPGLAASAGFFKNHAAAAASAVTPGLAAGASFVKNHAAAAGTAVTPSLVAGAGLVKNHAAAAATAVTPSLVTGAGFVKNHAAAAASTVTATASPALAAGYGYLKNQAAAVASMGEGVGMGKTALVFGGAAVAVYFLWPAAAATAGAATMNAPGAVGYVISRAAFAANTKLYFHLLHSKGAAVAAAAFA